MLWPYHGWRLWSWYVKLQIFPEAVVLLLILPSLGICVRLRSGCWLTLLDAAGCESAGVGFVRVYRKAVCELCS